MIIKIRISSLVISSIVLSMIFACNTSPVIRPNQNGHDKVDNLDGRRDAELDPLKAAASVELLRLGEEFSATLERPQESTTSSWANKNEYNTSKRYEISRHEATDPSFSHQEYVETKSGTEDPEYKSKQDTTYNTPYRRTQYQSGLSHENDRFRNTDSSSGNKQTNDAYSFSVSSNISDNEQNSRELPQDISSKLYVPSYYRAPSIYRNSYSSYHEESEPALPEGHDVVMSPPEHHEDVVSLLPHETDSPNLYRSQDNQSKNTPELVDNHHEEQQRQLEEATRNLNQVPSLDSLKLVAKATGWPATILTEVPQKDLPPQVLEKLRREYGIKVIATRDGPDQPLNIICEELTSSVQSACDENNRQRLAAQIESSITAGQHSDLSYFGIQKPQQKQQYPLLPDYGGVNPQAFGNVETQPNGNQSYTLYQDQ